MDGLKSCGKCSFGVLEGEGRVPLWWSDELDCAEFEVLLLELSEQFDGIRVELFDGEVYLRDMGYLIVISDVLFGGLCG